MYTRRQVFMFIPAAGALWACSSDTPADCKTAGKVASTATTLTVTSSCNGNHDHDYDVMTSDLSSPPAAGVSGESTPYDDDGHTHTVALTMAQLAQIEAGSSVTVTSGSTLNHTHTFTFHM
jgi:hypothetical protein